MKKQLLLILSVSLFYQVCRAQTDSIIRPDGKKIGVAEIDQFAQKLMAAAGVTGISLGIVQHDQAAYVKTYGFSNLVEQKHGNNETSLYAASFTKSLFAYMVMQLADQQLIDLDKPLWQYLQKPLPEYSGYSDLAGDDRWKLLTARQCLSHTTGFPNWRQLNPKGNNKLEIFFTPGSRYAYSGEGIYLLQMVIEEITGESIESLAKKNIFVPFGLRRTSFVWQPGFEENHANGHSYDEDSFPVRKRLQPNAGGSMQTTINDYTNFIAAVLQGKGISASSKKEMLSPQINISTKKQFPSLNYDTTDQNKAIGLSYGLGWGLFHTAAGQAFFKEGHSDDGWEHYLIAFPGKKSAFIIMSNSMNAESIFKELTTFLTGIMIPWEWEGYTPYQPTVKLTEAELEQYAGDYNGSIKAHFSIENGLLRVEAPGEGLSRSVVYAKGGDRFFMKLIPVQLEFLRDAGGRIDRVKVAEEGEDEFELKKVVPDTVVAEMKLPVEKLATYTGTYRLKGNSRTMTVELRNSQLFLRISKKESMALKFISPATFKAIGALDTRGEFLSENGQVIKMIIVQGEEYEWEKVK